MWRQTAGRFRAAALVLVSVVFLASSGAVLAQSTPPSGYGATLRWYHEQAQAGNPVAQFKLASLLEAGRGVEADKDAAEAWYRAAAFDGHAPAQYNLSLMLLSSARGEDALAEGLSWLMRARRGGITQAEGLLVKWRDVVSGETVARAEALSKLPL